MEMTNAYGGPRKGSGSKKKYNYPTFQVSIGIPTDLLKDIDFEARELQISRSALVVNILADNFGIKLEE